MASPAPRKQSLALPIRACRDPSTVRATLSRWPPACQQAVEFATNVGPPNVKLPSARRTRACTARRLRKGNSHVEKAGKHAHVALCRAYLVLGNKALAG